MILLPLFNWLGYNFDIQIAYIIMSIKLLFYQGIISIRDPLTQDRLQVHLI